MFKKSPTGPTIPAPVYLVAPATGSKGGVAPAIHLGSAGKVLFDFAKNIYIYIRIRRIYAYIDTLYDVEQINPSI